MDRKKIQELAVKIKALAASYEGVDQDAAMEIFDAAAKIEQETRKKPSGGGAALVV